MIRLSPSQAHAVLVGRKTMHRLSVIEPRTQRRHRRVGDERRPYGPPYKSQPWRPAPGELIDMTGGDTSCRIALIDVRSELLGAITFVDARAEGWRGPSPIQEFKAAWVRQRDPWARRQEIELDDEALVARFDRLHAARRAWVLVFRVDSSHRPRLLVPEAGALNVARHHGEHGYTENESDAMRGEPEAVDEATITRLSTESRARHAATLSSREEQLRTVGRRVREEGLAAVRDGLDVTEPLAEIERQLRRIERLRRGSSAEAA